MKYYKIVNPEGHHGIKYHEGLNTDPLTFNPSGDCDPGGIYFSREDILAFIRYGSQLYEVEPVGEIYENSGLQKKWKTHSVILKHIGKVWNNIPFLVEQGADIHFYHDYVLCDAASNGHLDVVKYLIEMHGDIYDCRNCALQNAAENGYLDIVKYLVDMGANIHSLDNYALRYAASNGHLDVVKYLVEHGANIHTRDNYTLRSVAECVHPNIVEYLKSLN